MPEIATGNCTIRSARRAGARLRALCSPGRAAAACLCVLLAVSAAAAPAAWYKWRSKLNGTVICAQVMQGEWEKIAGPFKDARCGKPGVPGEGGR